MNDLQHLAHGLAGDDAPADWPALTPVEVDAVLRHYPQLGPQTCIDWHSPRPLSAACLVHTDAGVVFIKRHDRRVRSVETLREEHRFIAHLRRHGVPIPAVLADVQGNTALGIGEATYEVHQRAAGIDLYRDAVSWAPLPYREHALAAGQMLARLHDAAEGYAAAQRDTFILVARSELICAADPVEALCAQFPRRPGLADYLQRRHWKADLRALLAPWHGALQGALAQQPRLWTHGDWHASNLCWSERGTGAHVCAVLDFGLAAANGALFDLAIAIERNAIAWLALETGTAAAHPDIAGALIEGYRQQRALERADLHLLANLLPLVHLDFALSEVEYYHAITGSDANADLAYDAFLRGHAAWFHTAPGQSLLQVIRDAA